MFLEYSECGMKGGDEGRWDEDSYSSHASDTCCSCSEVSCAYAQTNICPDCPPR